MFSNPFKKLAGIFSSAQQPAADAQKPLTWTEERKQFFAAVGKNDRAMMDATLAKYPEALEWRTQQGTKPLYIALEKKNMDAFTYLLDRGASPDQPETYGEYQVLKMRPLHIAASWGEHAFVRTLLERGADHAQRDAKKRTADQVAISEKKDYELADMILRGPQLRAAWLAAQTPVAAPQLSTPANDTVATEKSIKPLKPVSFNAR
ncbi:MAG: ankyrin repeat domain-containing protein [Micavibrio sp.]|nr:ankyrin repeat domain-containing protein [Micavibrio sp.]